MQQQRCQAIKVKAQKLQSLKRKEQENKIMEDGRHELPLKSKSDLNIKEVFCSENTPEPNIK
jgi:hypothetical protein